MRTCYDEYGNIISKLTQWDTNRTIIIRDFEYDTTPIIHFAHINDENSLVVTGEGVKLVNGNLSFKVPNLLLQSYESIVINIFICNGSGDNGIGINVDNIIMPVQRKAKPKDYTYVDDEELIEYTALRTKLDNAIENMDNTINNKVNEAISKLNQSGSGNSGAVSLTEVTIGTDKNLHFKKSDNESETTIKGLPVTGMGVDTTTGNLYYQTGDNQGLISQHSVLNTKFVKDVTIESGKLYIKKSDGSKASIGTVNSNTGGSGSSVTISIAGAHINESNHLIFTLSDGSTIDAGEITGLGSSGSTGSSDVISITGAKINDSDNLEFTKSDGTTFTINGAPLQSIRYDNNGALCYQVNGKGKVLADSQVVKNVEIDGTGALCVTKTGQNQITKYTINSNTGAESFIPLNENCDVTALQPYVWYQATQDIELSAAEQNDTLSVSRGAKIIVNEYSYIFVEGADGTYCTDWTNSSFTYRNVNTSRDWNYCYAFNLYDVEDHLAVKVLDCSNYSTVSTALNVETLENGTYIISGKAHIGCSTKDDKYRIKNVNGAVIKVGSNNIVIITDKGIYDISKSSPAEIDWADCVYVTKKYVDDAIAAAINNSIA